MSSNIQMDGLKDKKVQKSNNNNNMNMNRNMNMNMHNNHNHNRNMNQRLHPNQHQHQHPPIRPHPHPHPHPQPNMHHMNNNNHHNNNHHNNTNTNNPSSNSSTTDGFELIKHPNNNTKLNQQKNAPNHNNLQHRHINNNNNMNMNNNNQPVHMEQKHDPSDEPEQAANGVNGNQNGNNPQQEMKHVTKCEPFKPHKPKQPGLRANVFVSKECTRDLSEHIVEENWGNEHGMLYKYLDYIFRCQIFDHQVKKITYSTGDEIVVFHTGLQRRDDHNFLYFVLKTNDPEKRNAEQKWRVPAGSINQSCFSRDELMGEWLLKEEHLPQRTKFYNALQELLFDESYEIEVNWPERLRTNKERIKQELKHNVKDIDKTTKLVSELQEPFAAALKKAENQAKANPRLAVAQGFVETKHYKKRVELLLPLKVEYPKESGQFHTFALALRKVDNNKKYTGMSLLTMSMAYANARLVGYVDSSWLTNDSITSKKDKDKEKGDKERLSNHGSPQNSQQNVPSNAMMQGAAKGYSRLTFMTAAPNTSRSRSAGGYRSHQQLGIGQSLPAIPSQEPMGIVGIDQVNLGDEAGAFNIQTTNIYGNGPNNNHHLYFQKQAPPQHNQQQYHHQFQPSPQQQQQPQQQSNNNQHPYIEDQSQVAPSDQNLPLSQFDPPQQTMHELQPQTQRTHGFSKSGLGAIPSANNLRYSRSALPVLAQNPPELHNKLPEEDEEDDPMVNAPLADFDDTLANLEQQHGFDLGVEAEREIQNLKYGRSEPPIKTTQTKPTNTTNATSKFQQSSIRKKYQSLSPQQHNQHNNVPPQIQQHYHSNSVTFIPEKVKKYAQPSTREWGVVPYTVTNFHNKDSASNTDNRSICSDSQKFLLQLSRLPGDCGVNTLRQIFTATGCKLQSVHLVDDDKTAVLRFPDQKALNQAMDFVSQFKWKSKIVTDSPYLKNYDQQTVWQYQASTKWEAHHPEMARLIEQIPPRTDLIIEHGQRKYFIEKYNRQQGRQTNLRTRNQRMIRRIRIHVWAPKTNPIRAKAIPRIVPTTPTDSNLYDPFFYGMPKEQQQRRRNQSSQRKQTQSTQQQQQLPNTSVSTAAGKSMNNSNAGFSGKAQTGLNAEAKEYIPPNTNTPSSNTPFAINATPLVPAPHSSQSSMQQLQQQTKYGRSEPPINNSNYANKLTSAQLVPPTKANANKNNIVYDRDSYPNWSILEDDEPDYDAMVDACCTDKFSGIWFYAGQQPIVSKSSKNNLRGYRKEPLYYIPDAEDAKDLFENGLNASCADAIQPNFSFCGSVKKALEFNGDEPDDDNNVKVFLCEVLLSPQQQNTLNSKGEVNITDVSKIELLACASVNLPILKKAVN